MCGPCAESNALTKVETEKERESERELKKKTHDERSERVWKKEAIFDTPHITQRDNSSTGQATATHIHEVVLKHQAAKYEEQAIARVVSGETRHRNDVTDEETMKSRQVTS
jgi:uncharacterized membrane protein YheB (UPF0754 family)